ncbi:Asp-tRNA(Asn)/Glu-tRNA(Gln) amidotransferase GatCAB subunit C [Treponema phagedenis]|uniref:Glutamyl-tRNA(Gln) amidotransferase subunit C n=1 Tax=Treponema phagedenis TaxID=162 RepID=A0A0B7GSW9_TREPH|nr:Asp-tRNA(Asn)/Glu-tRNA(Gln) amidotransferase subunit GatC [Treponema phagedenis]EFW37786.1 aspartyl/glutamyl-tRNA(Asn/Gln) amidotransferase, C subunit [Treponema phagedenis F0421]NVP25184.1 Asp-tRNA(Asn)/Glu-tRNA(Gln) amidotransferase subunit GatC [Treponema phagedenis]QEJ95956.1 Asp-tRNA(Asn)/Glu-tRNA(Gln) amidotransferase subunit GatC [Treponema phagedenis]QEJ97300.1 Asp-tRNA(Asn)/Glu-tRNA(Gln) amidotransferase subunit GatC [Treponema phagedenis]QEK00345.1 Asp-tRNA(Asn)/Glu-tRNA(Gln) amid
MEKHKITPEIFDNLLYLSRLSADDANREETARQVEQIVQYFDVLSKYDEPDQKLCDENVQTETQLRSDVIKQGIDQSGLKKMTPEYMDGYFRVPKVLGSGA